MLGRGRIRTILGTDPAAGVEISETVPAGAMWLLRAIRFALTTDATAANRSVSLILDDGTASFWAAGANVTQVASLNYDYSGAYLGLAGQTTTQGNLRLMLPIPPVLLQPGYRFRTGTVNLQAGDDYAAPTFLIEEW